MLTTKELQAIKDRLAKAKMIWATISPLPQAFVDIAALIAEVEQLQAEVKKLQAISHRDCRMKAAFPGAYTEQADGLVTFDMEQAAQSLGMFHDIVVGRDGQPLHPMEGDLHFRVSAGWLEPEVWIELPVQVGNHLSSWSYRVTLSDWVNLVDAVNRALDEAAQHLKRNAEKEMLELE